MRSRIQPLLNILASFKNIIGKTPLINEGFWVLGGQVVSAVGAFAGVRILTELLPPEIYGSVSLWLGCIAFGTGILCMPLYQAAIRYYPDFERIDSISLLRLSIEKLLSFSTTILIIIFLFIGLALSLIEKYYLLIFLTLSGLLIVEVRRAFETSFLTASRRQSLFSAWVAVETWVRLIFAIPCIFILGATALSVLIGFFVGTLVVLITFMSVLKKNGRSQKNNNLGKDSRIINEIKKYSFPLSLLALFGWISSLSDRYIIGGILGLEKVGIYAAVYGIVSKPFMMIGETVELTIRPIYFGAVSSGKNIQESNIFKFWIIFVIALCIILLFTFLFLKEWIASLLLAQNYYSAIDLMPWIAGGISLLVISYILEKPCYAYKETKWILIIQGGGGIASLFFGVMFVYLYGIWGAAVAVPVYYGIQMLIAWYVTSHIIWQKGR